MPLKKLKLITFTSLTFTLHSAAPNYNQMLLEGAEWDNEQLVKSALENKANVNVKVKNSYFEGKTALHLAAMSKKSSQITAMLLKANADVNALDDLLNTPLLLAINRHSDIELVNSLLNAKANVNVKNVNGHMPLHAATTNLKVAHKLLLLNAQVNSKNNSGDTPLHSAVSGLQTEMIEPLLEAGANFDLKNKGDKTAIEILEGYLTIDNLSGCRMLIESIIEQIKEYKKKQERALIKIPQILLEIQTIPLPIAKLIAQYSYGFAEFSAN